jgi:hypothetical protein
VRSSVARPLVPGDLALALEPLPPGADRPHGGECWSIPIDPAAVYPDGRGVRASEIAQAWEAGLRRRGSPHHWLLRPLEGLAAFVQGAAPRASGLRPQGERLVLCFTRPTPDLAQRLSHPALWYSRETPAPGREGPGPWFLRHDELLPNPAYGGPGPYLERLELMQDGGNDRGLLLRLGEADLAVLDGQAAGALLERGSGDVRIEPLTGWDSVYFLWLDPSGRWTADPTFRRWLAGRIDRPSMLSVLFDDRGEVALSLTRDGGQAPPRQPVARPPFARSSAPRLSLAHDRADTRAASIAARLRESLKIDGVELSVRPRDHTELFDTGTSLILLAHRPSLSDPILALLDSLWRLGGETEPEIARLERASRLAGPEARRDAARQAERALMAEARLVPLVRLQSWLARSPSLVGVDVGPPGVIDLRAAWWRP